MVQDVVDAGAEVVMDTDGQIVYYNSGRQALDKSDNDKILQLKSGLPSWQTVAGGGSSVLLDYENFSSASASYTKSFSPALDEDDYSQFMIAISGKTNGEDETPTIIFSDSASNVYAQGQYNNRTTIAILTISDSAPLLLMNATGLGSANTSYTSLITFTINNKMGYITGIMETLNGNSVHSETKYFEVASSDLSSIEIAYTGSGEYQADSQFAVWGFKNA